MDIETKPGSQNAGTPFPSSRQANDDASSGATHDKAERSASRPDLKSLGIDTDRMTEMATDKIGGFQQMAIDEVRARPLRTLGWVAAAGFVFGLWSAR